MAQKINLKPKVKNLNFLRQVVFFVLLFFIFIRPAGTILNNWNSLTARNYEKQYEQLKKAYYSSQFVQKKNPHIIPDETFRAFAGGAFLKGLNPILITHDHPPLGNYLIAFSILIFDNARTLMIPIMASSALGIYLISKLAIKNSLFALIPMGIFVNEPLFLNKFNFAPLVEPIQFPFILFSFYFFLRALGDEKYKKWFILTSIFLGVVISTRFFVTGGVIVFCMILYLLYKERRMGKKLLFFIFTLPLSLIVLVLSYTRTLMDGYTVIDVFRIQKYILAYHKSKFILPFSFWDLLLFNRWHTWWGNWSISSDSQWQITWPISVFLTFVYAVYGIIKKISFNDTEKFLFVWLIVYTATLSTGFSSTNYFFPIIPFFYILVASFSYKLLQGFLKKVILKL